MIKSGTIFVLMSKSRPILVNGQMLNNPCVNPCVNEKKWTDPC